MTAIERQQIARDVIKRLGLHRAKDGTHPTKPPIPNKFGVEGVDLVDGKFRARIRFCSALSGQDTRLTLGRFATVEQAYFAYQVAHVAFWGAISYFAKELNVGALV